MNDFKQELGRKAFHFLSSVIPAAYFILTRSEMTRYVAMALTISLTVDLGRFYVPRLRRVFEHLFGRWLRPFEFYQLTGATYFLIGSLLTVILVPDRLIVISSLLFLAWGDLSAALIGKKWGRIAVFDKTLEGSLACFFVCFIVSLFLTDWRVGLIGAIVATLVEVLPLRINDNVTIPISSALVMAALS
ncbi:MAG: hypothetical protein B6244_10320 [Candidatus Cloacimonetes bacterium 4572_55]|nr:MAG: hypothetical protein B6244_10320 [Candidatus Cloacimonetes bacterium 4572_55]